MIVMGIDPGLSGAIAGYDTERKTVFYTRDLPILSFVSASKKKSREINARMLANEIQFMHPDKVFIERVGAMPGQGVTSMFNFGMSFGVIRGVVEGYGYPVEYVRPQTWKKHYGLGKDKSMSRVLATRLFPNVAADFQLVKDDGRAEAALLAAWGGTE